MKQISCLLVLCYALAATSALFSQNFNIQLRDTLNYPGQTLANVCGYAHDGREYALVGASKGLSIVDVTNPDNLVEIVQIPGIDNLWREIKVYSHYAYVTTEGGSGVQIVDLENLPSPNLSYRNYQGNGAIDSMLKKIHALHIDTTKGFLYTFGGNLRGAMVHDLNTDPYYPVYVGRFDQLDYIHDGYADNDTLYSCHIYSGQLAIVDMRDKQNPLLLGTVTTPGRYTHNAWLLDDHKHILTTDEAFPSFLTSYDISDPGDIKELDRFSSNDGNYSIAHNTHVLNNWAVTAWYNDGVVIVDASRPGNLVLVGSYDTWTHVQGISTDGSCWGAYPFLPSGTIVATNTFHKNEDAGKLFSLTPNYKRAAYLEGQIIDACSGQPLQGATIKINSNVLPPAVQSNNNGQFKSGISEAGVFTVTISKSGYTTQTMDLDFAAGKLINLNIVLEFSAIPYNISGALHDQKTGLPLGNTELVLKSYLLNYRVQSDASGIFDLACIAGGTYRVGTWGYLVTDLLVNNDGPFNISLQPGYYDDFELDMGWFTDATATTGLWEIGEPLGTILYNDVESNPDLDIATDNGDQCYVTGNGGGYATLDDIDEGYVLLESPKMKLAAYDDPVLSFYYWLQSSVGDRGFYVYLTNGGQYVQIFSENTVAGHWRFSGKIPLKNFLTLSDSMQVRFLVYGSPPFITEAAVDVFEVKSGLVGAFETVPEARLGLAPNPSISEFSLEYNWPGAVHLSLEVRDILGQLVAMQQLSSDSGTIKFGAQLPSGVYLVHLRTPERQSAILKAIKH